mmetsp:Transcript_25575/g.52461  ORF Transcript_25575/g.52461 Transcript_25575/m.52461 type:complete len:202 (-) Transcript_25575:455-1060(-)
MRCRSSASEIPAVDSPKEEPIFWSPACDFGRPLLSRYSPLPSPFSISSSSSSPSSPPNRSSSSSSLIEEVLRTGLFALPAGGGILMLLFLRRLAGPESPRFALGCSSSSSRPKRSSTPRAFSSAFRSSSAFSDASSPNSSLRVDRLLKMSWSLSACPSTSMNSSRKSSSVSIALVTRTFSFFLLRLEPLMILRTASGVRAT